MVLMNIKLDNILCFRGFEANFSYPSKLPTSLIQNENLKYVLSFRYRKLNVFLGSNASGKTSLIKTIWQILFFFKSGDKNVFTSLINMKEEESYVEVDLAEDSENRHFLHRFKIKTNNKDKDNINIKIPHTFIKLSSVKSSKDSYESKVKDLNKKRR